MRQYLDPNVILDRFKEGSETVAEVCSALGLLRTTVQAQISRMVTQGYLHRLPGGQLGRYKIVDPRAQIPRATARGAAVNDAKLPAKLRDLLRQAADGLTVNALAEATGARHAQTYSALSRMADAYIDRWEKPGNQFAAVWSVVVPPEHCPRPNLISKRRAKSGI